MEDSLYQHWTHRILFTPGVKHVADIAGAYWLIDAIASHLTNPLARQEEFQVWRLVKKERGATLTMTDGNSDKAIITQEIEYTDYPEPEVELYLVGPAPAVLMLPCEY